MTILKYTDRFLKALQRICREFSLSLSILAFLSLFLYYFIPSFAQDRETIEIFPPDSKPFGQPYEHYLTELWKLSYSIPKDKTPLEDKTGERCTYGQDLSNSSVVYLVASSGGAYERTCVIPSGLGTVVEIMSVAASDAEAPGATIEDLHSIAKNDQDSVQTTELRIDDIELENLTKYRFHTGVFDIQIPKDAMFGLEEGKYKAVADGHIVILAPLAAGNYTIHSEGVIPCLQNPCLKPTYATDVKYNLIVE